MKTKGRSSRGVTNQSPVVAKEAFMKTSTRSVLALSACSLLGLSTTASGALGETELATKIVRFKDLDIATASGAHQLYGRIVAAAHVVCREQSYTLTVDCRTRAVDEAVHGVGSPLLISIHRSTAGGVEEVVLR
jgi:UrcA family protein